MGCVDLGSLYTKKRADCKMGRRSKWSDVLCTRQPRTERSARVFILSNLKIVQCVEDLIKVLEIDHFLSPLVYLSKGLKDETEVLISIIENPATATLPN